jgi:hypothetical protein
MTTYEDTSLDPAHRMVLAIQYTKRGGVGHVEAIALPTWRDRSVDDTVYDPDLAALTLEEELPVWSALRPGPLPPDEDVTLLFVHGARLVLRFDDAPARTG